MFRKCAPDEFGFISKKNFIDRMRKSYRMTETESLRLFELGGGSDAIKSGELNYGQFCNALLSGGQNLRAAGRAGPGEGGRGVAAQDSHQAVASRVSNRRGQRVMTRIGKLLSKTAIQRNLKNQFRTLQEGNGNVKVSTKLKTEDLATLLQKNEIDTTPEEVRDLFGVGPEGITYSQLCRTTFNCECW